MADKNLKPFELINNEIYREWVVKHPTASCLYGKYKNWETGMTLVSDTPTDEEISKVRAIMFTYIIKQDAKN